MMKLTVLKQENIENRMTMDIFKNSVIMEKQFSIEIENLISKFSKYVADGKMKYFPAVKSLSEYLLKNNNIFSNKEKEWKARKKYKFKFRIEHDGKNPTTYPSPRKKLPTSTRYILDAIDYYSQVRKKYRKSQRSKFQNIKKKFDETRQFTGH